MMMMDQVKVTERGDGDMKQVKDNKTAFEQEDIIQDVVEPFVKILSVSDKGKRCEHCFKLCEPKTLMKCSGCKVAKYCGKECQKQDWKCGHRIECKNDFYKHPKLTNDADIFYKVIRTLAALKLNHKAAAKKLLMYDGSRKSFNDLLESVVIMQKLKLEDCSNFMPYCALLAMELDGLFPERMRLNEKAKFVRNLIELWELYEVKMPDCENEENVHQPDIVGFGLYVEGTLFEHSCRPNSVRVINGNGLQVRCISTIVSGEKPTVSYIAFDICTLEERKKILEAFYGFDCKCQLCQEEETRGPLVDYDKLRKCIDWVESFDINSNRTVVWAKMAKIHKNICDMLMKLYNEYDERITRHRFKCYMNQGQLFQMKGVNVGNEEKKFVTGELSNQIIKAMSITFGDHPIRENFQKHSTSVKLSLIRIALKTGMEWKDIEKTPEKYGLDPAYLNL